MGIISRRFRWLQLLFPPAEAKPLNPSFVSDDIVLTQEVLPGTEDLSLLNFQFLNSAAGVPNILSTVVPDEKFWYVPYCSFSHDDPVARPGHFGIQKGGTIVAFAHDDSILTNIPLSAPRPLLLPAGTALRAALTSIVGTKRVQIVWAFLELDVGAPVPRM